MKSNFWAEVEDAYDKVCRMSAEERVVFLDETYRDRPDIRFEVESLLKFQPAADRMSQSTLLAAAADMFNDDDQSPIGAVVAGRYLVRERLGTSPMSEVFRADHVTLDTPFALKRAAPGLKNDPEFRRRLIEEARRAVVLKHDNVARVHDIVESGGDLFVVMEYIDGETLRARLKALGRPMSTREFLNIAIECASALAAAHEKLIVHLDVKPENIMLTAAGQVKVCDFGVARKLSKDADSQTTAAEPEWTFAGTPAYMAPEVILSNHFDESADQFSLGVVFYEMLTGRNPFLADTIVATTARVVNDVPPPVSEINPEVDRKLERIVMRLLAKDPEKRFATTTELVGELNKVRRSQDRVQDIWDNIIEGLSQNRWIKIVGAMIVAILVAISVFFLFFGVPQLPGKKILVVLPFRVIGDSRGDQFYSDGVAEILTGRLSQLTMTIRDLQVVPASEIRNRKTDTAEKARAEFGATIVMTGTFQFSGDVVRVSYSVLNPITRREIRAGSKVVPAADPFTMQDAVTRDVAKLLELELTPPVRRSLEVFGTTQPEAYFLFIEGSGALREPQDIENVNTAINLFQQATERDSAYAAAYAGLGQSYWFKFQALKESGWLDQAQVACEKAASIDSQLSQAFACLGLVGESRGAYERAAEDFNRAITLDPANDDAQGELGRILERTGRLDDAEKTYLKAVQLRPQYWANYVRLAQFYRSRRHSYPAAIDQYHKALAASPGNGQIYYSLASAYIDDGQYEEAISRLNQALQLRPKWETYYNLGVAYLRARRYSEAISPLEEADRMMKDYRASGSLARIYWLTGQSEKARSSYEAAITLGEKLLQLNSRDSDVHLLVGRYYAMLGKKPEAQSHLDLALNASQNDPHYLVIAAVSYLQLGDRNTALSLMEQALAHGAKVIDIRAEPELDVLQGDPRYTALMPASQRRN